MPGPASALLLGLALALGVALPLQAARARGRRGALFAAIGLGVSLPPALVLHARLAAELPEAARPLLHAAFLGGLVASGAHLLSMGRARLRPRLVRYGVSLPGMAFLAMGALAGPWLLVLLPVRAALALAEAEGALAALAPLDWAPPLAVAAGVVSSLRLRRERVRIRLGGPEPAELTRLPAERVQLRPGRPAEPQRSEKASPATGSAGERPPPSAERPLRIVQIADPHLGPWQPVHRLRRRVEALLHEGEPDLVCLTGDFLTLEGNGTPGALAEALAPLAALRGRCFAVFGNHDHEAPAEVRAGLAANDVELLADAATCLGTAAGPVQILGADYARGRAREEGLRALLAAHPRREGHLRLLLVHDPQVFRFVPKGEADLVLSGHTHGGQVGLVSFGLDWTVLSRSRWPDHGLFGLGPNRLYVHRGTGFYGFPLRLGVPGEASVLEVRRT